MAAGAAMLLVLTLAVLFFHKERNPTEELAVKAKRTEVVDRMRLALASASEAEKSAVLATTDQESQTFADQARKSSAAVAEGRKELDQLLETGATKSEKEFLDQFSEAFADFQRIDNDLLSLAVKNTNLKAYTLAFGPAAAAMTELESAISHLVAASAASAEASTVTSLALSAEIGALRIQALLPPHIAEESDKKMEEMEAQMGNEEDAVRKNLEGLAALPQLKGNADLQTAASRWARFSEIKAQILALSRENTNVRSLNMSVNRKRTVTLMCQNALAALQKAIQDEPIGGVTYGYPAQPR